MVVPLHGCSATADFAAWFDIVAAGARAAWFCNLVAADR